MLGGVRFADRKEIRDLVAYLQLINNHADRERLLRIINEPRRKIGEKTLEAMEAIAAEQNCSLFHVMEQAASYIALQRSAPTLINFTAVITHLTDLSGKVSLPDLIDAVLNESGYRQMLIDAGPEEAERLENLEEFKSSVIEYCDHAEEPTLTGFLEENALVADVDRYDDTADAVVMMTIHSAKGLEFPIVFLPGMEDGIFPGTQTLSGGNDEMEEERRLAYVAVTRAKKELQILHAKSRLLYGSTAYNPLSCFVSEIPKELIQKVDAPSATMRRTEQPYVPRSRAHTPQPLASDVSLTVGKPLFKRTEPSEKQTFSTGDRVLHAVFGEGSVLSVHRMATDTLLEVAFDKVGTKKLMATYARLKKLP